MPVLIAQMGHVGRTSGATGAPGEMAFTQRCGDACAALLNRDGWSVRVIPADTADHAYRGDAFVAFHADGNTNPSIRGASVGYQTAEGARLAAAWARAYTELGWPGPWHPDNYTTNLKNYYGVGKAVAQGNRVACIVECGTITNPVERDLLTSPDGPTRAVMAVGAALGMDVGPIQEADMQPTDRVVFPYPYRETGDTWTVSQAMGFPLYITADMAKDDDGMTGPTVVEGSNRLSIPALRNDVDALHDKIDALTDLVQRALGST